MRKPRWSGLLFFVALSLLSNAVADPSTNLPPTAHRSVTTSVFNK